MSRIAATAVSLLLASALLAACGDDQGSEDSAAGPTAADTAGDSAMAAEPAPSDPAGAGAGTTIKASDSEFGTILFDDSDQAIYLFEKENSTTSECYGECAKAWPPVVTEGAPQVGAGAKAGLLGTTQRNDGTTQVTYNDHPLYYYVDDPPGEVLCHDVEEFGGLWLVVDPAGEAVR